MLIYLNLLIGLLTGASVAIAGISLDTPTNIQPASIIETFVKAKPAVKPENIPKVPFYSQFEDISSPKWKKLGCGIASLAMLINFYQPGTVSVDTLLNEGLAAGAFIDGVGWKHYDLAMLAANYGLTGANYDLSHLDKQTAFAELEKFLAEGPVIASVHYTFQPTNPIPHLAVVTGVSGDTVYYNDPAGASAGGKISISDFLKAWKKRFIAVRS